MFVFGIAGWKGKAPAAWAEESRWADGNIPPSWSELSKPTWFCDICNKVFSNGGAWYNHKKEKTELILDFFSKNVLTSYCLYLSKKYQYK